MTELKTDFQLDKQPTLLDMMQQSQRVTGLKNLNLGEARRFQAEDASAARMAKLAQLRSKFTNPQTGQVDRSGYQGALNMSGMGSEADADQAGQYEMQQKKLETASKNLSYALSILPFAKDNPDKIPFVVRHLNEISQSAGGPPIQLTEDSTPEDIDKAIMSGIPILEKLKMQFEESKALRDQYNKDADRTVQMRGQDITKRGQDLTAQNSNWVTTVGSDGLPVLTQGKKEGMKVYSPTGISNKPMTEGQGKANIFSQRAASSHEILMSLEGKYDVAGLSAKQSAGDGLIGAVGNTMLDQNQQSVDQAQRDFVNAVLRNESGAVIDKQEFANAQRQYFPVIGDTPETIAQKQRNREMTIKGLTEMAGPNAPVNTQQDDGSNDPITIINPETGEELRLINGAWVKP